jgi:hypothetical protein
VTINCAAQVLVLSYHRCMARKSVEIVPATGGGWRIVASGQYAPATKRIFKTQKDAVSYALTTVRSSRVTSAASRQPVTRTVGGDVKKSRSARDAGGKSAAKGTGKGSRKSGIKSKATTVERSPLARPVKRAQAEYDRTGEPGNAFRELLKTAAKVNEAALDRLAQ